MGRRRLWAGALTGAVVAAGCGGGGEKTPTGPATRLPSYLARYPAGPAGAVYFLQWQRREDSVAGTLTIVAPAEGRPSEQELSAPHWGGSLLSGGRWSTVKSGSSGFP